MADFWNDCKETCQALYDTVVDEARSYLQTLRETWPIIFLLMVALSLVFWLSNPPPSRHIVMSTGPEGSAYSELGKKYAEHLAKKGIDLELRYSVGALNNAQRVKDPKDPTDITFVPSGLLGKEDTKGIVSLGAVEQEPIWFFYRGSNGLDDQFIRAFKNKKVVIGANGSATNAFARKIFKLNNEEGCGCLITMFVADGIQQLIKGNVDGIILNDSLESPNIQKLLQQKDLHLLTFTRADAYEKLAPYLQRLVIPQGAFDLSRNFPEKETELLASTVNLVAKENFHPALQMLFLEAAKEINGKESFFAKRGEFPSFKDSTLPESSEAKLYYEKGLPLLMQYLPFWIAEFITRMTFLLLPFALLAYPVLASLPGYRIKRIKARIVKNYGELKFLEQEIVQDYVPEKHDEYLNQLDQLEQKVTHMKIHKSVASDYFTLRSTIDFVRSHLDKLRPV